MCYTSVSSCNPHRLWFVDKQIVLMKNATALLTMQPLWSTCTSKEWEWDCLSDYHSSQLSRSFRKSWIEIEQIRYEIKLKSGNLITWRPGTNILKCTSPKFFFRHRPNLLSSQITNFVIIQLAKTARIVSRFTKYLTIFFLTPFYAPFALLSCCGWKQLPLLPLSSHLRWQLLSQKSSNV